MRALRHLPADRVPLVAIVVAVVAATIVSPAQTTVVELLAATVLLPVVITYAVVMSVAGASCGPTVTEKRTEHWSQSPLYFG